jgi:hypothetical protein
MQVRLLAIFGVPKPLARALRNGPIIMPSMLPEREGENINGPSLIRVPEWVKKPLGRYYLYFAHHRGTYIRMAYADDVEGDWTILPGGVLSLPAVPAITDHIASPDLVVDHERRQIRMYFHGPSFVEKGEQRSFVALSDDGISFVANNNVLGPFYFRVFQHRGAWYALSKGGLVHRSPDGMKPFTTGNDSNPGANPGARLHYNDRGNVRHVAVQKMGDRLSVYFTRIGDKPERILRTFIDLSPEWTSWVMGPAEEVIRPTRKYEGSKLPLRASKAGPAHGPENSFRDPAIFVDNNHKIHLLYSVMGESGIGIAEVIG